MTFEQRQLAEEEIAAFIHRNMVGDQLERCRGISTTDKLVLMYGACALMFDGHMHKGQEDEAQRELAYMVVIRRLIHAQIWIEENPAA